MGPEISLTFEERMDNSFSVFVSRTVDFHPGKKSHNFDRRLLKGQHIIVRLCAHHEIDHPSNHAGCVRAVPLGL